MEAKGGGDIGESVVALMTEARWPSGSVQETPSYRASLNFCSPATYLFGPVHAGPGRAPLFPTTCRRPR